ncbi:hypothetical protein GYA44_00920 [Candidatus Microgenomates bacterium]|nr:hypothetical protein [Candidatus Microgenomates bacterium]
MLKSRKVKIFFSIFLVSLIFISSLVFLFLQKEKENAVEEDIKGEVDIVGVPYITNSMPISAPVNEEYLFVVKMVDSNTDVNDLVLSLEKGPSWLSLDENVLSGTPLESDKGTYKVSLRVSDGTNSSTKDGYILVE